MISLNRVDGLPSFLVHPIDNHSVQVARRPSYWRSHTLVFGISVNGCGLSLMSGHNLQVIVILELFHQLSFAHLRLRHMHPGFLFCKYGVLFGEAWTSSLHSLKLVLAEIELLLLLIKRFLLLLNLLLKLMLSQHMLLHSLILSLRLAQSRLFGKNPMIL